MVGINIQISDEAHKVLRDLRASDRKLTVARVIEQALLAFGGVTPTPEPKAAPEPTSTEQRPSKGPGVGIVPDEDDTELFAQLDAYEAPKDLGLGDDVGENPFADF